MIFLLGAKVPAPEPSPAPSTPAIPEPFFTAPTSEQVTYFLDTLAIAAVVAVCVYFLLFYVLRTLFRRWETDVALVILSVSRIPVLGMFIFGGLKLSLENLGTTGIFGILERLCSALIVGFLTYWIGQLFTQVIVYYLKVYARRTEALWDDVLIPILQTVIPPLIYIFGGFTFLQSLGIDLTGLWVAVGGVTFVLGFAFKEILADFFSGLVLLIDTPFQFGDMITMANGDTAVIRQIGLRVTKLYLIDSHCEIYTPNAKLAGKDIVNLSRPTPHYAYSISVAVRVDADPLTASRILKEIVVGHPDTLGRLEEKLECLDKFYGLREAEGNGLSKKEAGRLRLLAEKDVRAQLQKIDVAFDDLVERIKELERGGLDLDEMKVIQKNYQEILKMVGLRVVTERKGKRLRSRLEVEQDANLKDTLIGLVRAWYNVWLKDPDLVVEDQYTLPEEWEPKIELMKIKMNRLYQKIANPEGDETRLDDYTINFGEWLKENFKQSQTEWKEPTILLTNIKGNGMEFTVRFYVDNIKLEHWWRGNRVTNEVRREMVRRLRLAYIYNS